MLKVAEWSINEGTNLSKYLRRASAGGGIEGILTFLDNNILTVITKAQRFRD